MSNHLRVRLAAWLHRKDFRQNARDAFKTGIAAAICLWLGHLFKFAHSYWAAISAVVVMGADRAVTFTSARDRMIGTAVGALLGWATFYVWHAHILIYAAAVALCLFLCSALAFDKAGRLAGVALTIIVLIPNEGGPRHAAFSRFLEVGLGILVALVVTLTLWPQKPTKPRET